MYIIMPVETGNSGKETFFEKVWNWVFENQLGERNGSAKNNEKEGVIGLVGGWLKRLKQTFLSSPGGPLNGSGNPENPDPRDIPPPKPSSYIKEKPREGTEQAFVTDAVGKIKQEIVSKHGKTPEHMLIIDPFGKHANGEQTIYLVQASDGAILRKERTSLGRGGLGNEWRSNKTPVDLMMITKIVKGQLGQVIKGLKATKKIEQDFFQENPPDALTSAVFTMDIFGGHNARIESQIRLHGTLQEHLLGKQQNPERGEGRGVSHGCPRTSNEFALYLADKIKPGTVVKVVT